MEQQFSYEVLVKLKKKQRRKIWRRILSVMMCVVVFWTTYALILPAITMESATFCGVEAHIHDEKCYEKTLLCQTHVHEEGCCEKQQHLLCELSTEPAHLHTEACNPQEVGTLICTLEELQGHTHTEACMPESRQEMTCTLPEEAEHSHTEACAPTTEIGLICAEEETPGHSHTEACVATEMVCTCQQTEAQAHSHDESCYIAVCSCTLPEDENHAHGEGCYTSELGCGQEETAGHIHEDGCYTEMTTYVCGQEEALGHTHADGCFTEVTTYACGLEETAGHTHADECYTVVTTYACGQEEIAGHTHEDSCYTTETIYDCGQEETPAHVHGDECFEMIDVQICTLDTDPEHVHTEACYESTLTCQLEAHEHGLMCFSDPNADVETEVNWKATFPKDLTGVFQQDVVAIAKSQLGYTESIANYRIGEDEVLRGYTRYGAWYGEPYSDWNAMFAAFCLYYAGAEDYPTDTDIAAWAEELREQELFVLPSERIPQPGDLIFFDQDLDGTIDHVGLVEEQVDVSAVVIEGDINNRVSKNKYELHDHCVVGYGVHTKALPPVEEETPVEETPVIDLDSVGAWADLVAPPTQETAQTEPEQTEPEQTEPEQTEPQSEAAGNAGSGSTFYQSRISNTYRTSARAVGTPLDLTPYILTVAMYDSDGKLIPSGSTVTEGDLIEFRIEYTVTGQQLATLNGETVTVKTDTLTYDIPRIFQLVQSDSGTIVNSAGQTVGFYNIDSNDGKITMSFTDDYVKQNADGMQIHGNISFFSTVVKITDSDDEHQDYKFTDKITLGVNIEENDEAVGDLKIEKKALSVNGEEITYEVKVTSVQGTKGSITITDEMSDGLTFVNGVGVWKGNEQQRNVTFNSINNGKAFTLTLPEMAAGESYTVRYKCRADVDLLDADMTVSNTATVTGKDSHDRDLEDKTTVDYVFDMLKKTGVTNEDGSITWTITINQAKLDISGWILEDVMNGSAYTGTVLIKDSSGNVVANGVRLPYTFPNGSEDTYTVTYITTHGYGGGDVVYNTAVLRDNDTRIEYDSGVGIGSPFTKSGEQGELFQDENGTNLLPITWTVTLDTTNGSIAAGEVIYDKMNGSYHTADMYMTYDQLMAALDAIEAELVRVGSSVSYVSAEVYVEGASVGRYYNGNALASNADCKNMLYERFSVQLGKAIPEGQKITFSYNCYGAFTDNMVEERDYKNRIGLESRYEVEAVVKYSSGKLKATKYAINYYDPYANNPEWHWETIFWESRESVARYDYELLHDAYLAWAIELSVPQNYTSHDNLVIYEDLPDGVNIKSVELPFQDGIPTSRVQIKDMAPGKTYNWTFTLYPAEQYINKNYHDGTETTIVFKVTEEGDLEITLPGELLRTMSQYIDLHNGLWWNADNQVIEWYGYLYIYTQIDDDLEWTPSDRAQVYVHSFENRYTVVDEDGDLVDIGSQTQIITKNENEGAIRKEANVDNNNIITYSVVLNAYKKDLIPNSGILAIHDELTYTSTEEQPLRLRLVPGSVKLYEIRMISDGGYTKIREVTANYNYEESFTENGKTTTWVHTIDLNVPDGVALLLEYSYKANGVKNVTHDVLNVCTISGVGEGGLEGDTKMEIEVKDASAQADTKGVLLYKVDANSDGVFLENARFNIYIWNDDLKEYIIVHHPNNGDTNFTTNSSGMIVLDTSTMAEEQFAYNTAYYIVEVESPDGYYLSPEPYYFYIVHDDTTKYPHCRPQNFEGHALTSGDIIYRENVSEVTEISIEKYWKDLDGNEVKITGDQVSSITVELWRRLQGQPGTDEFYGSYTITPDAKGNWSLTITDLPRATKSENGTRGTNYLYYVKEIRAGRYTLEETENNGGINSGVIKLVNREQDGYVLPETGSTGTRMYTLAGLLLMIISTVLLLYIPQKRGRRNCNSS